MTTYITLQDGSGTEQSLADWGFALDGSTLSRSNSAQDVLTLPLPGASISGTPLFAFEDILTLRVGRTRTGTPGHYTYAGGALKFQGKMQNPILTWQGNREVVTYVILGPWYDLEHTLFQQTVTCWNGSALVQQPKADLCLFTKYDSGTGGLDIITTGQQITEILNYLLGIYASQGMAAPFQVGTIDTSITVGGVNTQVNVPTLTCKPMMCSEAIRKCLQISPDAVLWFDYSTNPPTINVKRQSALTAKTLAIADGVSHKSIRLIPRYDLQVRGVKISYKTTGSVNGNNYVEYTDDKYPSVGFPSGDGGLRVIVESVDLAGAVLNTIKKQVTVADATVIIGGTQGQKRTWWATQQSKFADYHVRFQDAGGAQTNIPDATITDEDTGAAVSLGTYPNQLREGTIEPWMELNTGGPVIARRCLVTAAMAYAEYDANGATPADTDTNGNRLRQYASKVETKRITLTNAVTGTYSTFTTFIPGESVPVGLASTIYTAMNALQYEGTHNIVQDQIGPDSARVGMGNTLNLSGGEAAWATMTALIQGITEDLGRGTTEINVGPAKHLNAQELWAILGFWRFRLPLVNTLARASGIAGDGTGVEINRNIPKSDSNDGVNQKPAEQQITPNTGVGATGNAVINLDANLIAAFSSSDIAFGSRIVQPRIFQDSSGNNFIGLFNGIPNFSGGGAGGLESELTISAVHEDYVVCSGMYTLNAVTVHSGGGGSGYAVNDVLTVPGSGTPGKIKVTSVTSGAITGLTVIYAGAYTADPAGSAIAVTNFSSSGSGATVDVTSNNSVNVAKQFHTRYFGSPITETELGITYANTYSDSNHRVSSDGTNTQNQQLLLPYETGKTVVAMPCNLIAVNGGSVNCTMMDNTASRIWLEV